MASNLKVLVIGATGKQGGAVVNALLSSSIAESTTIFAPTRDVDSASAKRLATKSNNIRLVKGQMEDSAALFKQINDQVDTVYCVTVPSMKKSERDIEEKQGKSLVDAAVANGVKHFVFSSVDRGGTRSDNDPTPVPHFISKHNIEVYLKEQAARSGMKWTILRPVFFLDNLDSTTLGKVTATCWASMQKHRKLQVVAVRDIGKFAAKAIERPDEYQNRALSLAGDELTFQEANEKFRGIYGKEMPRTFGFVGGILKMISDELGLMFKWFDDVGYGADVGECKAIVPDMQDFEGYVKESRNKFE